MIARSTGAAPRQRGSSEGCTLRIGCAASSGSPISAPKAQTTTVGGPGASSAVAMIAAAASGSLTRAGWTERRGPSRRAVSATGGLRQPPAAPARPVRARDHQRRAMALLGGEPLEHRGGEVRGAEVDDAHSERTGAQAALGVLCASRIARIASLRASLEMRSSTSVPSRWSISCWITRASSPSASISSSAPVASRPRTRSDSGPLDLDVHAGQAQAALFGGLALVALPLDLGVHEHRQRVVDIRFVDEHAVQDAELRRGEARRRARRASAPPSARPRAARRSSKRSTGNATARSTGSPNFRTRRSAASRRARVSGSSSSTRRVVLGLDLDVVRLRDRLVLVARACVVDRSSSPESRHPGRARRSSAAAPERVQRRGRVARVGGARRGRAPRSSRARAGCPGSRAASAPARVRRSRTVPTWPPATLKLPPASVSTLAVAPRSPR